MCMCRLILQQQYQLTKASSHSCVRGKGVHVTLRTTQPRPRESMQRHRDHQLLRIARGACLTVLLMTKEWFWMLAYCL
jgi:hypothetical protein